MWRCFQCDSRYEYKFELCPTCLRAGTLMPLESRTQIGHKIIDTGIVSADDLRKGALKNYKLGAEWDLIFPDGIGRPIFISLWGLPGSGKTTLALILAAQWARKQSKALYCPIEEGHGITMRKKLVRLEITNIDFYVPGSPEKLLLEMKPYSLIVIDSHQKFRMDPSAYRNNFIDAGVSIIVISQVNTEGEAKGGYAVSHEADAAVKCSSYGFFEIPYKNRFGRLHKGQWAEPYDEEKPEFDLDFMGDSEGVA